MIENMMLMQQLY